MLVILAAVRCFDAAVIAALDVVAVVVTAAVADVVAVVVTAAVADVVAAAALDVVALVCATCRCCSRYSEPHSSSFCQ